MTDAPETQFYLKLNGTIIDPKIMEGYKIKYEDLDSDKTKRSARGNLIRYRLGQFPTITVKMCYMGSETMQIFQQLLKNVEIYVEYWDPDSRSLKSGKFYSTQPEADIYIDTPIIIYQPFTFELISYDPR